MWLPKRFNSQFFELVLLHALVLIKEFIMDIRESDLTEEDLNECYAHYKAAGFFKFKDFKKILMLNKNS